MVRVKVILSGVWIGRFQYDKIEMEWLIERDELESRIKEMDDESGTANWEKKMGADHIQRVELREFRPKNETDKP